MVQKNRIQHELVNIWKKILGINEFSIDDNFFLLGGDSILGSIMISYISSNLDIEITFSHIIKYPTIREISEYLTGTS